MVRSISSWFHCICITHSSSTMYSSQHPHYLICLSSGITRSFCSSPPSTQPIINRPLSCPDGPSPQQLNRLGADWKLAMQATQVRVQVQNDQSTWLTPEPSTRPAEPTLQVHFQQSFLHTLALEIFFVFC